MSNDQSYVGTSNMILTKYVLKVEVRNAVYHNNPPFERIDHPVYH